MWESICNIHSQKLYAPIWLNHGPKPFKLCENIRFVKCRPRAVFFGDLAFTDLPSPTPAYTRPPVLFPHLTPNFTFAVFRRPPPIFRPGGACKTIDFEVSVV